MNQEILKIYQSHLENPDNNQGKKLSHVSVKNYVSDIRKFLNYLNLENITDNEVRSINLNHIDSYKSFLTNNGTPIKTINRYISSIRRFGNFISKEYGVQNPAYGVLSLQNKIDLDSVRKVYEDYLSKEGKSLSTVKNYSSDVEQFFIFLKSSFRLDNIPQEAELTQRAVDLYVAQLSSSGKSTDTINRHISSLKNFFAFAIQYKFSPINPFYKKESIEVAQAQIIPTPRIPSEPLLKPIQTNRTSITQINNKNLNLPVIACTVILALFAGFSAFSFIQDTISPLSKSQRSLLNFIRSNQLTLNSDGSLKLDSDSLKIISPLLKKDSNSKGAVAGVATLGGSAVSFGSALDENFNLAVKGNITGNQLISTTINEAPLVVASDTLVNNLNADMVDGFHADTNAGPGEIPAIDQNGQITFTNNTKLYSDSSITVESASLNLASTFGSDGSINLTPDGGGKVSLLGNNQNGQTLLVNNAQLTSGSLIQGQVGNNSSNFSFLKFLGGNSLTPVFEVKSSGDLKFGGKFTDKYATNIPLSDSSTYTLPAGTTSILDAIKKASSGSGDSLFADGGSYIYPKNYESLRIYDSTGTDYLEFAHNGTDGQVTVQGTTRINFDPSILISGSLNVDGDLHLGDAITDTVDIRGTISSSIGNVRISDDITLTSYINCGALETDSSGILTCGSDDAGSDAIFQVTANVIHPNHSTVQEFAIGGTSTSSATFHVGLSGDIQVGGSAANVSYSRFGTGTTSHSLSDAYDILASGELEVDGQSFFDGAATFASTITMPNSNTLTGVSNFVQLSQGLSVGGATTYYFNTTGDINANSLSIGGTSVITTARVVQNVTQLTVDNLRLDGNTLDTTSGNLTIDSTGGTTTVSDNLNISGNLTLTNSSATTTFGGITYTWPTSGQASNYVLTTNGSGTLSWVDPAVSVASSIYWTQANGSLFPKNSTVDAFIGGQSTESAKFAFLNVNSGTPTASISAGTAGAAYITATGSLQTTANQSLSLGGSTTGNILLNSDGNNNVGIGTTNPDSRFHVVGNAHFKPGSAAGLGISDTWTGNSGFEILTTGDHFQLVTGGGRNISFQNGGTLNSGSAGSRLDLVSGTSGYAAFFTGDGIGGSLHTERMRLTQAGNLGLGTTGPDARLDSLSTSGEQLRLTYTDSSAYAGFTTNSSGDLTIDASGGNLLLADGDTLAIGGGAASAFNFFGDSVTGASANVNSDDDLYIEGNIEIDGTTTLNNVAYTWPSTETANYVLQTNGSGTLSWVDPAVAVGSSIFWTQANGAVFPKNSTVDAFIGGQSTESAKFAFLNVNSGTPTASISAGTAGATYINAAGSLQTTANQSLSIGGSTTGDILLNTDGNNYVGIGTTTPGVSLEVGATANGNRARLRSSAGSSWLNFVSTAGNWITGTNVENAAPANEFGIRDQGAALTRFLITSTGNVGIGTTGPDARLDSLSTTEQLRLTYADGTTYSSFTVDSTGDLTIAPSGGDLNITGNVDISGTLTAGTSNAFQVDSSGRITSIDAVAHTIDDVSGNLTLTSNSSTISLNDSVTFASTTTLNGITYTWPGSQSTNYVLLTNGSGTLSWADPAALAGATNYWDQSNGMLFPKNSTVDAFIGGQSTASADFAFINVNSGTPTATIAGVLSLAGDGIISTSNFNRLTLGNSATGDIYLTPGTGKGIYFHNANNSINSSGNLTIAGNLDVNGTSNDIAGTLNLSGNALTSSADLTITPTGGDLILSDTVTLNIGGSGSDVAYNVIGDSTTGASNVDSDDDLYIEGNLEVDGTLYATVNPGFTTGSVVFQGPSGLAQDNANFFWDDTNDLLGLGTNSPIHKLQLTGAVTGKALAVFNETGNQDIFTASASGTTRFVIQNDGDTGIGTNAPVTELTLFDASTPKLTFGNTTRSASSSFNYIGLSSNGQQLVYNGGFNLASGYGHVFVADSIASEIMRLEANGKVGIGNNAPVAKLHLTGQVTGKALSIFNETGDQDIFTASASGVTRATITNAGQLRLYDSDASNYTGFVAPSSLSTNPVYTLPSADGTSNYVLTTNGSATLSWQDANALVTTTNYWNQQNGSLFPNNSTVDAFIGGQSTASAKFAFLNVNNGTPTASISAGTAGASYITANGTLATTAKQSLNIGGSTTGNINILDSANSAFATFTNGGVFTLDSLNFDGTTIGLTTDTDLLSLASAVLTVNGDLILSDTSTLEVGGKTGLAYNAFANSGDAPEEAGISSDNDLYIGGDLEVDGTLYATINPGFTTGSVIFQGASGLSQDNANFFWDDTNNKLGLGTTTPLTALDIEGSASMSGTLSFRGTTDPKINILNGENFGIRTSVGGDAGLTERFTVLNNGYVGIGTAAPTSNLDILTAAGAGPRITFRETSGGTSWQIGANIITGSGDEFAIYDNGSSATRLLIDSGGKIGVGTTSPAHLLHITGATVGKALVAINETGDQAIFTASASGTSIFTIGRTGNISLLNNGTADANFNLASTGDFTIQDNGATFATFTDTGVFTLDSLNFDGTTIGLTTDTDLLSLASAVLTVNGDLVLSDTSTLEVGGKTGIAYNAFANLGDAPEEAGISSDNDLYIGGDLEVDGQIYGTIVGTINPNFTTGSVVFQGASGFAEDNANFFWDDTNNRLGLGTASPTTKFHLVGNTIGKALAIFNETGTDQNILTASASGTTVLNLDRSGNLFIEGNLADLSGATLSINDNLSVLGTTLTIGNGSNASITTGASSDLTLNPTDDIYFDDTRTSAIPFSITDTDLSGFPAGDRAVLDAINYLKSTLAGGGGGSGDSLWRLTFPLIHPDNLAYDLGIGGTSSSSALFHVEGNTGNASTSGMLSFRQVESNIQSILMQTLQIGGNTTGNIIFTPNADVDDYLTLATTSNVPSILGTGAYVRIGDAATSSILSVPTEDDLFVSNRLEVNNGAYFGGIDYLEIQNTGDLVFVDANAAASITGPAGGALNISGGTGRALNLTGNDNSTFNVNGGTLTLDVSGDITIDADGADVVFQDGVSKFLTLTHAGSNNMYFASGADGASFTFRDDTANNNLFAVKDQGAYVFTNLLGKSSSGDPANCTAGDLYFNSADATIKICSATDTWEALDGGGGSGVGTDSKWRIVSGALSPTNDTVDVMFGGVATTSADFAFTGLNAGNTPIATFSGNLVLNASTPTISTTNSRDLVLDASGSKVIIQDDIQINGGDILGSSGETRITLSDSIDTTLVSGKLAVNVISPVENVDIDGDIKLINTTTQRGDIYTHANALDRLWTNSNDFNYAGASQSSGMKNPADNNELKLKTITDVTNRTWTSTADFNATNTTFSSGMLNPATNNQLQLSTTFSTPAGLAGWIHRKGLTVNNGSGGTLTNHQVWFVIDTAALISQGKMQSDCDDIRITDSTGTTTVNHYIETGCNTANTKIWFKAATLATGNNTFYIYYDNPHADNSENGDGIFDFFDDFTANGIDTSKWTITSSTGWSITSDNKLRGTNTTGRLTSIATFSDGYIQEAKYNTTTNPTNGFMAAGFRTSTSNGLGLLDQTSGSAEFVRNNSTWTNIGARTGISTDYVASISATSSTNVKVAIQNYSTSAWVYSPTDFTNTVASENIVIGRRYDDTSTGQAYDARWDWIRVRKYVATEPTVTIGSEVEGLYDSGDQTWTSDAIDAGEGNTFKPTLLTFSWINDSTASATTIPKVTIQASNNSDFSSSTYYPNGVSSYWQDGGTYDINSGVDTNITAQVVSSFRYWRVIATINTGTYRLDTPKVLDITLSGQGQYSAGSQFWVSEVIDAGSGNTFKPNRFTASWTLDGSDNIEPQFQILGSNSTTFGAEMQIYPNGTNTYYQNGGTYDVDSGVIEDVSTEITTAYRYWKVKAIMTTHTDTGDTPKILDVRLQEERPLNLQPYGQKIGIGTIAPEALLDVVQNVKTDIFKVSSNSGSISYMTIKANGNTDFGSVNNDVNINLYGDLLQKEDTVLNSSLTEIKATHLYDTTRDSDAGAWRKSPAVKGLSWYTESKDDGVWDTCVITTDDRCGESQFPAKALLVLTDSALYIMDTSTNKLWMKFSQGNSNALGPTTDNTPSSVIAKDGVIYVGTNGDSDSTGLYEFDFKTDTAAYWNTTQRAESDKTLSSRNSSNSYTDNTNTAFALSNSKVNDLDFTYNGTERYLAIATDSGINLANLDYNTYYEYIYVSGPDGGTASDDGNDGNAGANAFDYNDTTYVRSNAADDTLIVTMQFTSSKNIKRYTIYGDDVDLNEAPANWTFQAGNDGSTWTTLDTQTSITNWTDIGTASNERSFDITNENSYLYYRLNVTDASNSVADSIRIAELQLQERRPAPAIRLYNGYITRSNITLSSGSATADPADLVDKRRDSIWQTSSGNMDNAWINWTFPEPTIADQYSISNENTAATYPTAWKFQGSTDGVTWTTLDTQSGISWAATYMRKTFSITNETAYKFYRLQLTNNNGSATLTEISSFDVNGPVVTASSSNNDTTQDEQNLQFQDSTTLTQRWISGSGDQDTAWVKYDYGPHGAWIANTYSVRGYTTLARSIQDWKLQGSNDNSNWTDLDTRTGTATPFATSTSRNTYTFSNSTAYRYYRLLVTDNNGDASFVELHEFSVGEYQVTAKSENANTLGVSESSLGNGTLTGGWVSASGDIAAVPIVADFGSQNTPVVTGFTLTGNTATTQSARDWTFQGSNDNSTWTTLMARKNVAMAGTGTRQSYSFSNNTEYRYYRLLIDRNNGHATNTSLSEFRLAGSKYSSVTFSGDSLIGANVTTGLLDINNNIWADTDSLIETTEVSLNADPMNIYSTVSDNLPALSANVTNEKYALEGKQGTIYYGSANGLDILTNNPRSGSSATDYAVKKQSAYSTTRLISNQFGLEYYWPFDETEFQSTSTDYGFASNDSATFGMCALGVPESTATAKVGRAYLFNRTDVDGICYPDNRTTELDIGVGGNYTVGAWIYPTLGTAVYRSIMGTRLDSACGAGTCRDGWGLYIQNTTSNRIYFEGCPNTEDGACSTLISDQGVEINGWTHVIVRRDSSGMQVFFNGQKIYTSSTAISVTDGSNLWIGGAGTGTNNFAGVIDEPFIATRALTDEEIRLMYQEQNGDLQIDNTTSDIFTANTIGSSSENWPLNLYKNRVVEIATETGVGQSRLIIKNTASTLNVTPAWSTLPDSTSVFRVKPRTLPGNTSSVRSIRVDQKDIFLGLNDSGDQGGVVRIDRADQSVVDYYQSLGGKTDDHSRSWDGTSGYDNIVGIETTQDNLIIAAQNQIWHEKVGDSLLESIDKLQQAYTGMWIDTYRQNGGGGASQNTGPQVLRKGWGAILSTGTTQDVYYGITYKETPLVFISPAGLSTATTATPKTLDECNAATAQSDILTARRIEDDHFVVYENTTTAGYWCYTWMSIGAANNTLPDGTFAGGADLAEWYGTDDDTLKAGEVVSIDSSGQIKVVRSDKSQDPTAIGIIATQPSITMGTQSGLTPGYSTDPQLTNGAKTAVQVALAGRVPVKVSLENGPIKAGDYLTTSTIPGYVAKAITAGPTVGKALENFDGTNTIIALGKDDAQKNFDNLSTITVDSTATDSADLSDDNSKVVTDTTNTPLDKQTYEDLKDGKGVIMAFVNTSWYDPQAISQIDYNSQVKKNQGGTFAINSDGRIVNLGSFANLPEPTRLAQTATESSLVSPNASDSATFEATPSGQIIIQKLANLGSLATGSLKTATLDVFDKLTAKSIETLSLKSPSIESDSITTNLISPLSSESGLTIAGKLNVVDSSVSGTLSADNAKINNLEVDTLKVNKLEGVSESLASIREATEAARTFLDKLLAQNEYKLESATNSSSIQVNEDLNPSDYLNIDNLAIENLEVKNTLLASDVMLTGNLFVTSISSEETLNLQPTGKGRINLLAGLLTLDDSGNININGDLTITGTAIAKNLQSETATTSSLTLVTTKSTGFGKLLAVLDESGSVVAAIDASGSAQFKDLETRDIITQNLVIAIPATESASIQTSTNSNAVVGVATIESNNTEVVITNSNVNEDTLIYITPTSDTQNQVLYVKQKETGKFIVAVSNPVSEAIKFNYWVVRVQKSPVDSQLR